MPYRSGRCVRTTFVARISSYAFMRRAAPWALAAILVVLAPASIGLALPIERWADGVADFSPGPDDLTDPNSAFPALGDPNTMLGPVDSSFVSLGEEGSATLSFSLPFFDRPGPDFAVFENPFVVSPDFGGGVFGELGFVEVSSDGVTFARFDSFFNSALGGFDQLLDPNKISGLAGVVPIAEGGDLFDLADLAGAAVVLSGDVDLDAIFFVRIIDIVGDGNTPDSFGNPIEDPWPTASEFLSSGFELDAIGIIPEPGTIGLAVLGVLGAVALRARRR